MECIAAEASARAAYEASRSALWPTLSAGLSATRSGSPAPTNFGNLQNLSSNFQSTSTDVSLTATASWEVDLWGRLSQASTGAQASLQASADDLAAARLSAQALLATTDLNIPDIAERMNCSPAAVSAINRRLGVRIYDKKRNSWKLNPGPSAGK